ncbi:MAG: hypothetical protein AB1847_01005 [bacterium]
MSSSLLLSAGYVLEFREQESGAISQRSTTRSQYPAINIQQPTTRGQNPAAKQPMVSSQYWPAEVRFLPLGMRQAAYPSALRERCTSTGSQGSLQSHTTIAVILINFS